MCCILDILMEECGLYKIMATIPFHVQMTYSRLVKAKKIITSSLPLFSTSYINNPKMHENIPKLSTVYSKW